MADVWSVLLIVAFFGVCVGLVRGCERIIGSRDAADLDTPAPAADDTAWNETSVTETVGVGR